MGIANLVQMLLLLVPSSEVVNNGKNAKATSIREGVADEVQAPALVGTRRQCQRASRSQSPFAPAPFAHGQLFFAIKTLCRICDDSLR
jgi:hypothetical protein